MLYKKRIQENKIKELTNYFKVIFLVGARQVGKSSLLMHLYPDTKIFVFDPVLDQYNVRQDPDLFLNSFEPPLILDEVQFVPEVLPSLKRKVDKSGQNGQYFLTSSQQMSILKNVSESLAGRVALIKIGIMSPQEIYDQFKPQQNWFIKYLKNPDNFFRENFSPITNVPSVYQSIWRGGMPGTIELPNSALFTYFSSYIQTYVERDVRLLENVNDLAIFGRFVALISALTAQEINFTQLGRDIGIAPATAQRWLNILSYSYQWTTLTAFSNNSVKRVSGKGKGMITDTGLACYLQRISSPDALAGHPMLGAFFESFCFNMLKSFCAALDTEPNFYHWRSLDGAEVDLLLEIDGKFFPIEVKCKSNVNKHDARGITAFKQNYPHLNIQKGIIIYAGSICYPVTEDVIAVPWNLE
jgi:predicted AAA+ superfamily ATPase